MSTNTKDRKDTPVHVIERVRAFNRSWTEILGLLDVHLLETDHTLTEARVLFELGRSPSGIDRLVLRDRMAIDQSFLTRVLARLERSRLISVVRDSRDGRRRRLTLTAEGRAAYRELDRRSARQIASLIAPLTNDQRRLLVETMQIIP